MDRPSWWDVAIMAALLFLVVGVLILIGVTFLSLKQLKEWWRQLQMEKQPEAQPPAPS
jgi:uncharacterized integral membrane protein